MHICKYAYKFIHTLIYMFMKHITLRKVPKPQGLTALTTLAKTIPVFNNEHPSGNNHF